MNDNAVSGNREGNMVHIFRPLFGLIGLVCLCVALGSVLNTRRFLSTAQSAQGIVVEIVRSTDSEGGASSAPKVHYTVNGEPYEFTSPITTNPPAYHEGQAVRVVYSRNAPGKGRLDVWWEHYFLAMLCAVIGAIFSAVGLNGVLFNRRR